MGGQGIDTQASLTISSAVLALVALIKWAVPGDAISGTRALLVVVGCSILGVGLWVFSLPTSPTREWTFGIFQAVISVSTQAAGLYGFATQAVNAAKSKRDETQAAADYHDPAARVSRY